MTLKKWNFETEEYTDIELPKNYVCPLYCSDMNTQINCASCGGLISYGSAYTSRELFNSTGIFGMPVCQTCYLNEIIKERGYK